MSENFSFLFQYLKKQEIPIDQQEFVFQAQSHPNFPSLLSISDTLSFLNINNTAASLNTAADLPDHSIALLMEKDSGRFLTYVQRIGIGYQYLKNGKNVKVSGTEFEQLFGKIALYVEKSGDEEISSSSSIPLIAAVTIVGLLYFLAVFMNGFSFPLLAFLIIVVVGLYFSIEAISSELGISTTFSEAVCSGATVNTDCSAVINSTKTKLLELISFTDVSITFFVAQLISILFFSMAGNLTDFYNLTFISLLFSFPVTIYSFYLQKFVAKTWCPVCLSIIGVLYVEFACIYFLNDPAFSLNVGPVIYYSLSLLIAYFGSSWVKKTLKINLESKSKLLENNRFKRNYTIFKMALMANGKIQTTADNPSGNIILGNPNSKLKIIMITSPYCGYCGGAHEVVEKILKLHKDNVAIHIRFNVNPIYAEEKPLAIFHKLINIYFNTGQDAFLKAMHLWFTTKDETKLEVFDNKPNPKINGFQLLLNQFTWNQQNNTTYTPAFIINGYLYPTQYTRDEIINFIYDLEEDDSLYVDSVNTDQTIV